MNRNFFRNREICVHAHFLEKTCSSKRVALSWPNEISFAFLTDVYGCGLPCSREPDPSKIVAVSYSSFSFSFCTSPLTIRVSIWRVTSLSPRFSYVIYLSFFFWKYSFIPLPNKIKNFVSILLLLEREREREAGLFSQSKYKWNIMDEEKNRS